MSIVINVLVTLALCSWPLLMMMSPMMFGAPHATNDKQGVLGALLFLSFPVPLFLIIGLFGGNYFGINSYKLALISAVVIGLTFSLFGYTRMAINLVRGIANDGYCVVNQQVYFNATLMPQADAASFVRYSRESGFYDYSAEFYARDKRHLYYQGQAINGVELENLRFKLIGTDLYWVNETQVIKGNHIIEGADPATYSAWESFSDWNISGATGLQRVFYNDQAVAAIDAASFMPLAGGYGKDKWHIYYQNQIILADTAVDTASFVPLDENFARDKRQVYYLHGKYSHVLADAEPTNFEIFERNYYRSGNIVYYVHQYESVTPMTQVDAASFTVTQYDEATKSDANDKHRYYLRGQTVTTR